MPPMTSNPAEEREISGVANTDESRSIAPLERTLAEPVSIISSLTLNPIYERDLYPGESGNEFGMPEERVGLH